MFFPEVNTKILLRIASGTLVVVLACCAGVCHYWHASTMFENNRSFSRLSPLDKEISLRTEMGFYYSFYKTLVEERVFLNGIAKLAYNKMVEYPDEVNTINRFNIYPEIMTGGLYHWLSPWMQQTYGETDAMSFYLGAVWSFAGATVAILFLSAIALCGNTWGGLLATLQYFGNHVECTRVMWAPNERENWAQPLLLAQAALVTAQLRRPRDARAVALQTAILFLNCFCLLFWQLSQFILLTQLAIVFTMEQLRVITVHKLMLLLHSHFCGLHMAILFTQGNDMLLTSLYCSFFAVVSFYALFLSSLRIQSIESRTDILIEALLTVLRISIVITASVCLKSLISELLRAEEDSHIFDILFSKFTNYKTFHTMLYTCSPVFGFLPSSYFANITKTGLLPLVGFGVSNVLYHWVSSAVRAKETRAKRREKPARVDDADDSGIDNTVEAVPRKRGHRSKSRSESDSKKEKENHRRDSGEENDGASADKVKQTDGCRAKDKSCHKWVVYLRSMDVDAGIFYNVLQMVVFGIMAIIIMRLKLLFTPQLCIVASLAAQPAYYSRIVRRRRASLLVAAVALAALGSSYAYNNFWRERSYYGEDHNPQLRQLLEWAGRAPRDTVWAASMPLAAAALLSARRAVVLHPHYEHHSLRQRVYNVYKMYGRFSPMELYRELSKLKVTHLIVDANNCYSKSG